MDPIRSFDEARDNIRRYQIAMAENDSLRSRAGYVRAWYAEKTEDGWRFAPSKFVGYRRASADDYLAESGNRAQRDGRETERILAEWYELVDPQSRLGRELEKALSAFLAGYGQRPNKLARINLPKEMAVPDALHSRWSQPAGDDVLERITVDRDICGGRPCIKGTRMRVADIVEAIAQGATREQLLADFDYLTKDDIAAALLYAARATDHRVVRTA